MKDLNELSATQAATQIRDGAITAAQLMHCCLDRIAKRDADVQAWAYLNPEHALEMARDADRRQADGEALGPLHGLPVGIKDIIDTADMPTQHGSALFVGRQPAKDAQCIAALRSAGAVIIGKTVTTELANTNPSKTRNPHNLAHTPGGSSAGSGAGVADFQIPLALGTQTGGSMIRPASFNGVYGLKPTLGLIPREGVLLQSHTLDTVGVYGRTLEDLALITDVLSAPDANDPYSYRGVRGNLRAALATALTAAPRLAFLHTPAWPQADEGAQTAMMQLVEALGDNCRSETLSSPWDQALSLHGAVFASENLYYYGDHFEQRPELMSEKLRARMAAASRVTARSYVEALVQRELINTHLESLFEHYDAVLCLSAPGPAPKGFETTGNAAFNSPWTYLGVPCISLPKLSVDGLPLGAQLVGRRGGESHLFRVARWLDEQSLMA